MGYFVEHKLDLFVNVLPAKVSSKTRPYNYYVAILLPTGIVLKPLHLLFVLFWAPSTLTSLYNNLHPWLGAFVRVNFAATTTRGFLFFNIISLLGCFSLPWSVWDLSSAASGSKYTPFTSTSTTLYRLGAYTFHVSMWFLVLNPPHRFTCPPPALKATQSLCWTSSRFARKRKRLFRNGIFSGARLSLSVQYHTGSFSWFWRWLWHCIDLCFHFYNHPLCRVGCQALFTSYPNISLPDYCSDILVLS